MRFDGHQVRQVALGQHQLGIQLLQGLQRHVGGLTFQRGRLDQRQVQVEGRRAVGGAHFQRGHGQRRVAGQELLEVGLEHGLFFFRELRRLLFALALQHAARGGFIDVVQRLQGLGVQVLRVDDQLHAGHVLGLHVDHSEVHGHLGAHGRAVLGHVHGDGRVLELDGRLFAGRDRPVLERQLLAADVHLVGGRLQVAGQADALDRHGGDVAVFGRARELQAVGSHVEDAALGGGGVFKVALHAREDELGGVLGDFDRRHVELAGNVLAVADAVVARERHGALGGGEPVLDRVRLFQREVAGHHGRHELARLQVGERQGTVAQVFDEHHVALLRGLAVSGGRGELDAVARHRGEDAAVERDQFGDGVDAPFVGDLLELDVRVLDGLLDEFLGLLARVPGRAGPDRAQRDDDANYCRFLHCIPFILNR